MVQWIHPRRLGKYRATAAAARRSRALTFTLMTLPLLALRIYAATRTLLEAGSILDAKVLQKVGHFETRKAMEDVVDEVELAGRWTFGLLADTGRANAMAWDVVLSAVIIGL